MQRRKIEKLFSVNYLKAFLLYMIMLCGIGGSYNHLLNSGYSLPTLLLENYLPDQVHTLPLESIGKFYIYEMTQFMVGQPFSLITMAVSYLDLEHTYLLNEKEEVVYRETGEQLKEEETVVAKEPVLIEKQSGTIVDAENFKDYYYVLKNYMTGPDGLGLDIDMLKQWNFYELVQKKLSLGEGEGPKILIFHTHSREEYIGGGTVVDVGEALKEEIESEYGIEVLHITDAFYDQGYEGVYPRGNEYENMEPVIRAILKEYPSISMVIDLHRDGLDKGVHLVTEVNGKPTAKVMFVNGLCQHRSTEGQIVHKTYLDNPYLEDNLALSMQAQRVANEYYPGLMRKIYCNEWRYSLHMMPLSLLVELGAQTNTTEEAMNAVEPLANILAKVVQKD